MRSLSLVVTATLAVVAACAEAGGGETGAGLTPEGTKAVVVPLPNTVEDPPTAKPSAETRWQDLYRDYFGPTGRPGSCLYAPGGCHNSASAEGFRGGGPNCENADICWQSFRNFIGNSDPERQAANFFGLVRAVRADGTVATTSFMPKEPRGVVFSKVAGDRVLGWIRRGAPND